MDAHTQPQAPALTLPEVEAAWLREEYARATTILEYGSGGSTALAAAMPGKRVFAVESDAGWIEKLESWFRAKPPKAKVVLHHADIGPTREWGWPKSNGAWKRFADYPLTVWDREDFVHPDLVLIDGRFRAGCLLATMFRIARPVRVLFDDYTSRKRYHEVEQFVRPTEIRGRMARFELEPAAVPADRLASVIPLMLRPL